jgi:hypothetical protein
VIWPKKIQISNGNFHSKFLKLKFSISSFEISKTKIFKFFHFNFLWHISKFSFNFDGMAKIFQMSVHISKSNFLGSIFPFPSHGMAKIFKFQKQKFSIQISKQKNQFFISNFPCGIKDFFLSPEVAKFVKRLQKLPIYSYQK